MKKEEIIEKVVKTAKEFYKGNHNCAESIVKSVIVNGLSDFPVETTAAATGFGGGVGTSGNNCGALTGAVMAVGMKLGRVSPDKSLKTGVLDLKGKPGVYRAFNQIPHLFIKEFGSPNCSELTKEFEEFYGKERSKKCEEIIEKTARMAAQIILSPDEYMNMTFKENVAGLE